MSKLNKIFALAFLTLFLISGMLISQTTHTGSEKLQDWVKYLASDELQGRFPGTEGSTKAAKFIEEHFKKSSLLPFNGNFLQEMQVTTSMKSGEKNIITFESLIERLGIPESQWRSSKQNWTNGKEFVPLAFSENGTCTGEVVFAGFGISADELKYDDYAGIDVKDKIVIVLSNSPDGESDKGEFASFTSLRYKASNAAKKGAKGMIMLKIQGDSMNVFERLEYSNIGKYSGIIAVQSVRQSISKFFPKEKQLVNLEQEIIKTKKPASFIIPRIKVSITVDLLENQVPTYNVVGMVKGTDNSLSEEYIVVGAHYDHLGWGGYNSSYRGKKAMVHNGADDNASGVAGMMELAEKIAANPLKRPVIFVAFTAEEMGLLGSEHFVKNSPVPVEKIVTMLNFDMIGRLKNNEFVLFGTNTSPKFAGIVDSLMITDSVKVIKASDAYSPSDHASFYKRNIPVFMFNTGVHDDYHRPSDDWDKLNYKGMLKVTSFAEELLRSIDANQEKPAFTKVTESTTPTSSGGRSSSKVWFGIIPNFEESPLGCKISGSSPGSPAEKAGLKENDIISTMNGSKVKNLHDFMFSLKELNPGDTVTIEVLRGANYEEKITLKVNLVEKK